MKKKQNILFVINTLDHGGAAKILSWVANNTVSNNVNVTILTTFTTNSIIGLDSRIKILSINELNTKNKIWRLNLISELRKKIKLISPDLIVSFVSDVNVSTILATTRTSFPLIVAERGDPYTLPFLWKILTKILYPLADKIIFQTEIQRNFYKIRKGKTKIIPNPYLGPRTDEQFLIKGGKSICAAGRFVQEKGFENLIDAFHKVYMKNQNSTLTIYGEGPLLDRYIRLINKLNIEDKVYFPGYSKQMYKEFLKHDIFVLSSFYEGIPNVLMEALGAGIPSISTNCSPGGPKFLTKNGSRGILVNVNDNKQLSYEIDRLLNDLNLQEKLSKESIKIKLELKEENIYSMWRENFKQVLKVTENEF